MKILFSILIKIVAVLLIICIGLFGFFHGCAIGCFGGGGCIEVTQDGWIIGGSSDELYIKGLSTNSQTKTILIIPSEYNGQEIKRFYNGKFSSDYVESLYFTHRIKKATFNCPNLKKVVLLSWESYVQNCGNFGDVDLKIYVRNGNLEARTQHFISDKFYYANTNFYYNYENAPSQGVYWIDNFDWGGKVEYIPQNPTREGYTFAGWYLEPECVNELNVDSFTMPQEELDENEKVLYQETAFYAKWIKN